MLSDSKTFFSKNHGWMAGMGDRTGRWAMVIEKDGSISYAENEQSPANVDVSLPDSLTIMTAVLTVSQVSSAETVIAKL